MANADIVPGDFAVLPSADHTYALDNFPTDEVPNVFAFEEVKSQKKIPQSLFSIVEEHAYAYRDDNMMTDEWSNLPGMNTEPHGVDVSTQTDSSVPLKAKEKFDEKEEYFKALTAVEKSIRMVTLTVSRQLIETLEAAATFLKLSLTVTGTKVRISKVSDLFRILMCSPKFSAQSKKKDTNDFTPLPTNVSANISSHPRAPALTRSGRVASKFVATPHEHHEEKVHPKKENVKEKYQCPHCQLVLSTTGCLTRHVKSVHESGKPKYACDRCPAKYKRRDTLLEHQATKHEDEPGGKYVFRCRHCFRSFKRQTLLNDHLNTHTGARTHPCSICNQRFSGRAVLRYHLKTAHHVTAALLKIS